MKKKTYFERKFSQLLISIASQQQNILITLNKLPKPDDLKRACLTLDEKLINQDHINAMLRIFPPPDVIAGLIEEVANTPEDEKWDKGEEYFLQIIDFKSIRQRLVVWQFKLDFPEKRDIVAKV